MASTTTARAPTTPAQSGPLSNLIRLAPLQIGEIPSHPDLPTSDATALSTPAATNGQPDLVPFLLSLLDDGLRFLSPSALGTNFKHHSTKSAPPSSSSVEVLTYSIPTSALSNVAWSGSSSVSRTKPRSVPTEHWFARRSLHPNISSKSAKQSGSASWDEFVYGLRDNHSVHEKDFTPTLYDARKVCDWDGVLRKVEEEGGLVRGRSTGYENATMGIYEMCHAIPAPMNPRCFPVLVATASVIFSKSSGEGGGSGVAAAANGMGEEGEEKKFIAVTVPLHLDKGVKAALYSSGQNINKGDEGSKSRKEVVLGAYTAVETVRLLSPSSKPSSGGAQQAGTAGAEDGNGTIEWVMATASDAKGILPMWMQKLALPGAVAKDVSFFMKWIKSVDEAQIEGVSS